MIAITILLVFSSANQNYGKGNSIPPANETGQIVKQTNKQTTDKIGSKITEGAFSRIWFFITSLIINN